MIAELGLAALWLAAALALLQVAAGYSGWRGSAVTLAELVRPIAVAQGILCLIAFVSLIWLFVITDLSVLLVASNSHVDKPMIFKIAGTWGNHEGSMLLWVTVLALSGCLLALFERRLDAQTFSASIMAQAALSLGFFAFLLFASNPFTRLDPPAGQGAGLNPLLQDIGLAFHPPTLYFGYVGLSVAFSLGVGALLTGKVGPVFARAMRPWVLGAWIFLTLGITAGSYWAYYELGWGGWWFWDPVENASLMPWFAATALLHSVSVLATRDALRAWTIMLSLIAFAMSMLGTFLVRSGILTSVHAFAVDPQRGSFILTLLLVYVGGALTLFALRIGTVREGKTFAIKSREAAIVGNNILLTVILAIVLIGTLWPLAAEAMGDRISVGPPYFNKATLPLAFAIMILLAVGPLLRWRKDDGEKLRKLALPSFAAIAAAAVLAILQPSAGVFPIIGLSLAIGLAIASLLPLLGRNLLRTPLPFWGMVIAHLGLSVSAAGMSAEAGWKSEKLAAMQPGETVQVAGWQVALKEVRPVADENWVAIEGVMTASRGDEAVEILPQARQFFAPNQQTTEAALLTRWNGQLYAVIAPVSENSFDRWQVRLWWKPFVSLIWLGGIMIAFGGALSLLGRIGLFRHRLRPENPWGAL
jgi:cytochrome c-type biogenesis protein CcmF